jgi:hypothetical protein
MIIKTHFPLCSNAQLIEMNPVTVQYLAVLVKLCEHGRIAILISIHTVPNFGSLCNLDLWPAKNSWGRILEKIMSFSPDEDILSSLWNLNIQCHASKNPPLDYFKDKNPLEYSPPHTVRGPKFHSTRSKDGITIPYILIFHIFGQKTDR